MKPIKRSVAFVIYSEDRTRFLIVRRPPDDDSLPNVWGLPAGSLKESETSEDTVIRAAKEKLGTDVSIVELVGEGKVERNQYTLQMREYEVKIEKGEPKVPQHVQGITQYSELKWGTADDLVETARIESLCSRLYLKSIGRTW